MAEGIDIVVRRGDADRGCLVLVLLNDAGLEGRAATLRVRQRARVKRSSPVHHEVVRYESRQLLVPGMNRFDLGDAIDGCFEYRGNKLDLEVEAILEVDDGVLSDSRVAIDLAPVLRLPPRLEAATDARGVHSPPDRFSFLANLSAIPARARVAVIWMIALGLPLMLGNALLGARDQFVTESRTWFYDHSNGDGESESPLMKALTGSGGVGLVLWLAIRRQLQKYMRFEASLPAGGVARGRRVAVRDIVSGESRVALEQCVLRLVAYNREHGQYTAREKSGRRTRTVTRSFDCEGRAVVLFEQVLPWVPAGAPLGSQVQGEVDFSLLFDALHPPLRLGPAHGLSLRLEAQLLHPKFVDHQVEIDPGTLQAADFFAVRPGFQS